MYRTFSNLNPKSTISTACLNFCVQAVNHLIDFSAYIHCQLRAVKWEDAKVESVALIRQVGPEQLLIT